MRYVCELAVLDFLDADLDALLAAVGELSDNPDGGQIAALAGATCRGDRLQDRDSLGRQVLDGARLEEVDPKFRTAL